MKKYVQLLFIVLALLCPVSTTPSYAAVNDLSPVFFIGEDILHPSGLSITVNEVNRTPYHGGLGASERQENLNINITLMNTGISPQLIDSKEDFRIDMGENTYPAVFEEKTRGIGSEFNVNPGTQTRIDLSFRIPEKEKSAPTLLFRYDTSNVRIVCDSELGAIVGGAEQGSMPTTELIRAARLLINSGRLTAAKNICEKALLREPANSSLLLLLAKISNIACDEESASYFINKISVSNMTSSEEAAEAAKTAMQIGYSNIAVNILYSFDRAGLLNNEQKALMARAFYYEDMYDDAMQTLVDLIDAGYDDKYVYFTLGNVYNKLKKNKEAIIYWQKAVDADPAYGEALFNLGVGYLQTNDRLKARECWEKVLRSNPDSDTLAAAEEALKGTEY